MVCVETTVETVVQEQAGSQNTELCKICTITEQAGSENAEL